MTVPELDFAKAHVQATSDATFVKAAGMELNCRHGDHHIRAEPLDFTTNIKEKTRELDATGQVVLHPDHQEVHLPELAIRTQGIEWRTAPGSQATVNYGGDRVQLEGVRLVSGDQSLDLNGAFAAGTEPSAEAIDVHARNVDLQQLQTLALQDRGLSGRSPPTPRISGSTVGTRGRRHRRRQQRRVPDVSLRFALGEGRLLRHAHRDRCRAAAVADRGDHREGQRADDAASRRAPATGHVEPAPGDAIDLQVKSTALSLGVVQGFTTQVTNVTGTLEADVHVAGSGRDPHLQGFVDIKNGGFAVPAAGGTFSGLTTRIDLQAGSDADPAVPAARPSR